MQPNEDLLSLINRFKSICTQLTYAKALVDEEDQVAILLKAIDEDQYEQIITILKEKEPTPKL